MIINEGKKLRIPSVNDFLHSAVTFSVLRYSPLRILFSVTLYRFICSS